ncbi:hypothetical protein BHE97_14070 [Aeromicrobium sp. PE09-221]|uniref:aldose 1-epimerase n=1 Tax=Aeromicrobium sp. PE09-221 TaxID=1898043 RepID=UPI000B3E5511|nr:hypothetical protein [Aeromicrobium sp. PE09-221]OUZ08343.1 hypothetical protein BHE97_14070 [Aeromicrobium sp. PE09-221]
MPEQLRLTAEGVKATIDPAAGARITSLRFDGHEVVGDSGDPDEDPSTASGIFPMVPWAGRWRGHRPHGLGRDRAWDLGDDGILTLDIADGPLPGTARLRYEAAPMALHLRLSWDAPPGSPSVLGFHPWFRRRLGGVSASIELSAESMLERGDDHLPTGRRVSVPPGPWDDCFRLNSSPRISWPGMLGLELVADTPWWVVYTERASGLCLEPQTAPPDSLSGADDDVEVRRRSLHVTIRAHRDGPAG